jgi:hypothetical protein
MLEPRKYEDDNLFMLRWTARIFAIACLAILFLFIFGESSDWSKISSDEIIGLFFFPVGLIVGLIIGWWKEFWGGAIAVGSVAAFYFVYGLLLNGSLEQAWWFIFFTIPGALFLAYGIALACGQPAIGNNVKT